MVDSDLKVRTGQVLALRLFDLAYEIDLKRAEELWRQRTKTTSTRSRLIGTPPKAVSFGVPPLALELGSVTLEIGGTAMTASAGVRLYDFGIAALVLRLPVRDLAWGGLIQLVNQTDLAVGPAVETEVWNSLLAQLRDLLSEALDRPTAMPLQEDYLIALVDTFDEPVTPEALWERVDLVPLLSGEARPLSDNAARDLLRQRFSYHPDDLVVLTWDRAFIYEPQQESDVVDVLEMANAQLLEMRTYDEALDDELPRMRDLVEAARSRVNLLASRRYARLARRVAHPGGRGVRTDRTGGQCASGYRGCLSGEGLRRGDGTLPCAKCQCRGGPQTRHHSRDLYSLARRSV